MSRLVRWLVVAAVGMFAVVALLSAAMRPELASPEEAARQISQSLRCPTCAGESIADSSGLLSEAMRDTVAEQVEQGRSPTEIRGWFAERYGDEVLLEPPRRGYGWLLWGLPLVMVGGTVVILLRGRETPRRRLGAVLATVTVASMAGVWALASAEGDHTVAAEHRTSGGPAHAGEQDADEQDAAVAVLRDAVEDEPGDVERRLALAQVLEKGEDTAATAAEYAAVVRLQPLDPDIRYRYAFALVRDGETAAAVDVLDETLTFETSHAPSLLLLGSLIHEEEPDRGGELLQRFVELEPDHPAADQITELLGDRPTSPE